MAAVVVVVEVLVVKGEGGAAAGGSGKPFAALSCVSNSASFRPALCGSQVAALHETGSVAGVVVVVVKEGGRLRPSAGQRSAAGGSGKPLCVSNNASLRPAIRGSQVAALRATEVVV